MFMTTTLLNKLGRIETIEYIPKEDWGYENNTNLNWKNANGNPLTLIAFDTSLLQLFSTVRDNRWLEIVFSKL